MNNHPFGGEPMPPPAPKQFADGSLSFEPMQIRVAKDGNSEFTVKGTPLSHFVSINCGDPTMREHGTMLVDARQLIYALLAINPTLLDVKR